MWNALSAGRDLYKNSQTHFISRTGILSRYYYPHYDDCSIKRFYRRRLSGVYIFILFFFRHNFFAVKKKTYILPIGRDEIGRDTPRIVGTCPRTCEPITSPVRFAVSTGDDNEELLRDIIIFVIMILIKVYAIRVPTRRIKFSIDWFTRRPSSAGPERIRRVPKKKKKKTGAAKNEITTVPEEFFSSPDRRRTMGLYKTYYCRSRDRGRYNIFPV